MKEKSRTFATYPQIGALSTIELCAIANSFGMTVISACKPQMHYHHEIGLYGSRCAFQKTLAAWGKQATKGKPQGTFGVNLTVPREEWVDVQLATARAAALVFNPPGWQFKLQKHPEDCSTLKSMVVSAPFGYRRLRKDELPEATDYAWHEAVQAWTPVLKKHLEYYGAKRYKEITYGVIRSSHTPPIRPKSQTKAS